MYKIGDIFYSNAQRGKMYSVITEIVPEGLRVLNRKYRVEDFFKPEENLVFEFSDDELNDVFIFITDEDKLKELWSERCKIELLK